MAGSGPPDTSSTAGVPVAGIRGINVHDVADILDRVPFGSVIVDAHGMITYLSRPYARFLGIQGEDAIGHHVSDIIENSRMHIVVQTGEVEIGRQRVHGQDLIVQRVPLRDESGKIVGAYGQVMFEVHELRDHLRRLKILESKVEYYERELDCLRGSRYTFENIIGDSAVMQEAKRLAARATRSASPVLLLGETGVGKELFAHAIHHGSTRRHHPLIRLNCAAMPRDLVESELFGYEPGAFSGAARQGKAGKFELAHQGSLFLDEIADMPLEVQAKVLRVLQEKEVERVGGIRPIAVDFRLLAATHEDLEDLVRRGHFRTDLYYRLNVFPIQVPALRERQADVPALVQHILRRLTEEMGRLPVRITPPAMTALQNHHWTGNVRELINVLERILNALDGDLVDLTHLPFMAGDAAAAGVGTGQLRRRLHAEEQDALEEALRQARGNKAKAARLLGIHRASLYKKLGRRA